MVDPPAMTRDEVRRVDAWAIEELGVPGVVLMENAGAAAAQVACEMLEGVESPRVAVLAGAGNNAGDGFVIARHLFIRHIEVDVFLLVPAEKIRGDARVNLDVLRVLGLAPVAWDAAAAGDMIEALRGFDLVVDAIGGTGIEGALRSPLADAVEAANTAGRPILAVDLPSGLNCDTGRAEGPTIIAARTVTFVAPKKGFAVAGAKHYTGDVIVASIGVPPGRSSQ